MATRVANEAKIERRLRMKRKARTVMVTWVVVYPMITGLLAVLELIVASWPMPVRTLLLSTIMVPLMVVWVMPVAIAQFDFYLNPKQASGDSGSNRDC